MYMSNNRAGEPFVYVRKRRTKRFEVVANVVPSYAQQDFSSKEICQNSSKTSRTEPKDLGKATQKFAHTEVCGLMKSSNAMRKGKEVYEEKNNTMDFADFYAQRGNKGITICEKSVKPRSEEMAKLLGTSNDHSSGLKLQLQDLNKVSHNYFLSNSIKEMSAWTGRHKPRIIVHPSKVVSPSRFSQNYDQHMHRTSVRAPVFFSVMKLITEDENNSTMTDEELLYAKELLSTQGLPSRGQRVQQLPCSQVGNYQNTQTTSGSGTSNFSYMKLLMEGEDNSILTNELYGKKFLSTQCSLSSQGQRVQQWPCSQVGNYQFENYLQQINLQNYQYQVLQQPQQLSYMDLLRRDDISYMDLLTRDYISCVDLLAREDISYMDLLTREDISWTLDA